MTTVGVILSGCGFRDGTEIREAVLALLALDRAGAQVRCFAPDIPQAVVIDHWRGKPVPAETRNVLVESARIARGKIEDVRLARAKDLDALVLPGGFGAAMNLSTFASHAADATVNAEVARIVREMHAAKKADRRDLHRARDRREDARGRPPEADDRRRRRHGGGDRGVRRRA